MVAGSMSRRAKLICSSALTAVALAAWWFRSRPADVPAVPKGPAVVPASFQPQGSVVPPVALDERTLVGTKWERDGFGFEFGADGTLLIGGRERAQWRVVGSRLRLYRDDTGEEHWLDIAGNRLLWEGREIGRVY